MIKYWMYYIVAGILLLHPHLGQKVNMLIDYFSHPEYEFWTTFSAMDVFDLLLHGGIPIVLIVLGIKKQSSANND